jgi:predicted nuclease of predicted toxin-antitoxin system
VKLLLDQNLSYKLVSALVDLFPDSSHVRNHNLARADDQPVWEFAKAHGFTLVSKDEDFHQRSLLYGHPPKVIWLRIGNCSTRQIEVLIRSNLTKVREFELDPAASLLTLP